MRTAAICFLLLLLTLTSCSSAPDGTHTDALAAYPEERPFAESRFITVSGVRLHYRTWAPENRTPVGKIMLIHGLGASTYTFRCTAPLLAEYGLAVVAVDLPSFGFSDPGIHFVHTLANRSDLLWTFADRLDTEQNEFAPAEEWYLLGHSVGGQVASRMALDRPTRTLGLVALDSELSNPDRTGRMMWFPPVRWGLRAWVVNSLFTWEGVTELLQDAYGRPPTDEEIAGYLAPMQRDGMDRGYVQFVRTVGEVDLPLEEISLPVLLVWGSEDTWVDLSLGAAAHARLPDSDLVVVPGAGHLPTDTHPDRLHEEITDWLDYQMNTRQ
jgi:pimeloyl-ACP methyl ester carboxylesterase